MFKLISLSTIALLAATTCAPAQNTELASPSSADYLFLKAPREGADVTVVVRPIAGQAIVSEVERINPNTSALEDELRINWFAQASCASGIQVLRASGPGGTSVQNVNGSRNTIAGRSNIQSFEVSAVDRVCIRWAESQIANCGWPLEPGGGCDTERTFNYDANTPLPRSGPVRTSGSCVQGQLPTTDYIGELTLRCRFE